MKFLMHDNVLISFGIQLKHEQLFFFQKIDIETLISSIRIFQFHLDLILSVPHHLKKMKQVFYVSVTLKV